MLQEHISMQCNRSLGRKANKPITMTTKTWSLLPTLSELFELFRSGRNRVIVCTFTATLSLLLESVRTWLLGMTQRIFLALDATTSVYHWVLPTAALVIIAETVYIVFCLSRKPSTGLQEIFKKLSEEELTTVSLLAQAGFGLSEGELSERLNLSPQHFLWLIDQLTNKRSLVNRSEPLGGGAYWSLSVEGRALAAELRLFPSSQPISKDGEPNMP
jgi:hypothetical protein